MKKYSLRQALVASACALASSLCQAASAATGQIATLDIEPQWGTFVFIKINASNTGTGPGCVTNHAWNYTLPIVTDQDKARFAMLLTAQASGRSVSLNGTGSCSEFGSVESLSGISMS